MKGVPEGMRQHREGACSGRVPPLNDANGYGFCPVCRRWWKLTKSGEVRKHRRPSDTAYPVGNA